MTKYAAIIVAGGAGRRFGSRTPKQFLKLAGRPVFMWSVLAFKKAGGFSHIILVVPQKWTKKLSALAKKHSFELVSGGRERPDSVRAGLKLLGKDISLVAVHDAARPLIKPDVIKRAVESARKHGSGVVSVPARDTVKLVSGARIIKTIPRETIWLAQTPQVFKKSLLEKAYAKLGNAKITDDAQAIERIGHKVSVVMGDYRNIKITDKKDFSTAQIWLKKLRG